MPQQPNERNVLNQIIGDLGPVIDDWVQLKDAVESVETIFEEASASCEGLTMTIPERDDLIEKLTKVQDRLTGLNFEASALTNLIARLTRLIQTVNEKSKIYYEHQFTFAFPIKSRDEDSNKLSWEQLEQALLKHLQKCREGERSLDDFAFFNSGEHKLEKGEELPT